MKSSSQHQTIQTQSKPTFIDSFNCRDLIQDLFFAFKIYRRRDLVNDIFHFSSIIQSALCINTIEMFYSVIELIEVCLKLVPIRKCNRKMVKIYSLETIVRTLYFEFYLNSENNH